MASVIKRNNVHVRGAGDRTMVFARGFGAAVSMGYARGKLFEETKTLPRDRKDWYD